MLRKQLLNLSFLIALLTGLSFNAMAQADPLEHVWFNGTKTGKIQIYKAKDGNFYGKIVWLKEPDRDGKPKTDINNPDKARHNDPVMNMIILKKFKKGEDGRYTDGTIYDPKNGKTYDCKMKLDGNNLDVRGYVMISLIGRTETWTRADQ